MKKKPKSAFRKFQHDTVRRLFALFPQDVRFTVFRHMVDFDPLPDPRMQFKIADTQEELEACFRILHDAYVGSGFMKPDPSGMRVTIYHALPTTTTLCVKFEGKVVGTISLIREGVFGFPLQSVFNLGAVRGLTGNIAEVSALAVAPSFRKTGGAVLFPLMKFMYDYCRTYFDTRHVVIAVNPDRIEMYESLLFFERLQASAVDSYDFVNGAPAVGAALDLHALGGHLLKATGNKPPRKNLFRYFIETTFANVVIPNRRYYTTNDPVMTPDLLDHFFNRATRVFDSLDERKKRLLHSIYDLPEYKRCLPPLAPEPVPAHPLRRHQRYSLKCPAVLTTNIDGLYVKYELQVIEVSLQGFQARCDQPVTLQRPGIATVRLGADEESELTVVAVRVEHAGPTHFYGFRVDESDPVWIDCVHALEQGQTHDDLHDRKNTAEAD